jgi:DNA polymerase III delta prime subunit
MDNLNLNEILNRGEKVDFIKNILSSFEENKNNLFCKKGIYIYGNPGSGKTTFVINILKEMNYDVIHYDAGDIRNKSIIDNITKHNMSDKNIMSLLNKQIKKIVIIMDEIDGMNNGDKGGINTLIKLIRPKKTKKQKMEEITMNPIICIGNYHVDKKIKELMKVCNLIELNTPSNGQVSTIIKRLFPNISLELEIKIIDFVQCDLRKLKNILSIYENNKELLEKYLSTNIFQVKTYSEDSKKIIQKLFLQSYKFEDHSRIMNETDRTIVGLLWHENIIDNLNSYKKTISLPFYIEQLNNICFADYMDRITFQKQIWQFNEMTSLIKTFKNNKLYHSFLNNVNKNISNEKNIPIDLNKDIRFTKVLTKYSTEYNNSIFIQTLCMQLSLDKKDLFSFFIHLRNQYDDNQIIHLFENYEINKLDIHRIYRYLDKYTKEITKVYPEEIIEEYSIEDNDFSEE